MGLPPPIGFTRLRGLGRLLGRDAEAFERLAGGLLLGRLLGASRTNAELLAADGGRGGKAAVVRRPFHLDDALAAARERLLQLGLVVDVARARVLDAVREGIDDRALDRLEAVLEEERRQRGLEQGREHVAVADEARELVVREARGPFTEADAELELTGHDRAARARDDVGADLREPALTEVGEALVQLPRHGELEHAVAEELEPLVRVGPVRRPGGVCEDRLGSIRWQLVDQPPQLVERAPLPTGAARRSRRPARRSGSSARLRPRS